MAQLSASIYDYLNRKVDYLAFDGAKPDNGGEAKLTSSLIVDGGSGALTTGIQKLVQRFLLELLTEKGSLQYQPDRGTLFITYARTGYIRTTAQLISAFNSAELDVANNLRLEENFNTDPLDERYESANLLSATLNGDTAFLSIRVNSKAGESRSVIYPLRVTTV